MASLPPKFKATVNITAIFALVALLVFANNADIDYRYIILGILLIVGVNFDKYLKGLGK